MSRGLKAWIDAELKRQMDMFDVDDEWVQTYTGHEFHPSKFKPEDFRIADISAALSKLCRYGGHCIKFYSVAEHCCLMASVAPSGLELDALMHDRAEAYLVDLPRAIKNRFPQYKELEKEIEIVSAKRFGLQFPHPAIVKDLDNRILHDEKKQNMCASPKKWFCEDLEPLGVRLNFWAPAEANYNFTRMFYQFGGKELDI